jgi:hypothetical protein
VKSLRASVPARGISLVALFVALGVLLTSCGGNGHAAATASTPLSKQLVTGQVVKLRAGVISTHLLGTNVSFKPVGGGVYGFQADETGFVVGGRPDDLQQQTGPDFGMGVNRIELPLERAALQLEKTPGVRVLSVDKGELFDHPGVPYPRLGGHPAHLYRLLLSRPELHEIFGIPAQSFSRVFDRVPDPQIGARDRRTDVVLVGVGDKTFLVRFGNSTGGLDPAHAVLMSLRFRG